MGPPLSAALREGNAGFSMKSSIKITLIYIIVSSLWIILSDNAITLFTNKIEVITLYSSIKGLLFVTVTSILLFVLINRDMATRNKVIDELNKAIIVKEQLIKELHHRIRNNIQVILSTISLETRNENFSMQSRDRIVNRLLSMEAVYNVVYNYEDMLNISFKDVLNEYKRVGSRNIGISGIFETKKFSIEVMITLLVAIDVILEKAQQAGCKEEVEIRTNCDETIDICISGGNFDIQKLLGTDEHFVSMYLKSIGKSLERIGDSATTIRISGNQDEA
jgi:hypothetical protein